MPIWADLYKYFTYAFRPTPLEMGKENPEGAGVTQPDAIPDIRGYNDGFWSGGKGLLRVSNDFVDLSSVSNRQARYKEYERLRSVAEIETALTVFADEMCVAGDTKVATPFGYIPIQELADKKPFGERFLVYCYDFGKRDYSLGWGHSPRKVKTAPTVKVALDNGTSFVATPDHRILLRSGEWRVAGDLNPDDELMPFYRLPAQQRLTGLKHNQFARVFTFNDGWKHERQFIDEWKISRRIPKYERLNKAIRLICEGLTANQICQLMELTWKPVKNILTKEGFTYDEIKYLCNKPDRRVVTGVFPHDTIPVYDLSVDKHENFCGESVVFHNCQTGENNRMFEIKCHDDEVKDEAEFLLHEVLEAEDWMWNEAKSLCLYGDRFWEIVISEENPKAGVVKVQSLPPDSMYRIETTKGKLLEFQQSKEGPDYQSLARVEVTKATEADLQQATALRFAPEQIIHLKIGDDRKTFYPYGISLVEAARGPAHQLRLMEDAMVVYRLTRAPERRVFYIDVGQLPPFKAEAFIERMKDQFRKKKVHTNKGGGAGASGVEERWHAPSQDEDYWLPIRPNSGTKIETLPGAQNLGEIDDALYFRNKLFIALNFPKNYAVQEADIQQTRITLSSQDVKFARLIERLQKSIAKGLREIVIRHLRLRGFPEDKWADLQVKMTPPSDWREISRNEVIEARYNRAAAMKGAQLMSDYDILVDILHFDPDKAKEYVARMKQQKLEDLKLQVMAQNPQLLGLGQPPSDEKEIGMDANGPNSSPGPQPDAGGAGGQQPPGGGQAPPGSEAPPGGGGDQGGPPPGGPSGDAGQKPAGPEGGSLPEPEDEDIEKYNLAIRDYSKEIDEEEVDPQELGEG
jgi:hypothetical protein